MFGFTDSLYTHTEVPGDSESFITLRQDCFNARTMSSIVLNNVYQETQSAEDRTFLIFITRIESFYREFYTNNDFKSKVSPDFIEQDICKMEHDWYSDAIKISDTKMTVIEYLMKYIKEKLRIADYYDILTGSKVLYCFGWDINRNEPPKCYQKPILAFVFGDTIGDDLIVEATHRKTSIGIDGIFRANSFYKDNASLDEKNRITIEDYHKQGNNIKIPSDNANFKYTNGFFSNAAFIKNNSLKSASTQYFAYKIRGTDFIDFNDNIKSQKIHYNVNSDNDIWGYGKTVIDTSTKPYTFYIRNKTELQNMDTPQENPGGGQGLPYIGPTSPRYEVVNINYKAATQAEYIKGFKNYELDFTPCTDQTKNCSSNDNGQKNIIISNKIVGEYNEKFNTLTQNGKDKEKKTKESLDTKLNRFYYELDRLLIGTWITPDDNYANFHYPAEITKSILADQNQIGVIKKKLPIMDLLICNKNIFDDIKENDIETLLKDEQQYRISLSTYMKINDKSNYSFYYYNVEYTKENNSGNYKIKYSYNSSFHNFEEFLNKINPYLIRYNHRSYNITTEIDDSTYNNFMISKIDFFNAYTRGRDLIEKSYLTKENILRANEISKGEGKIENNNAYFKYKYSGRDIILKNGEPLKNNNKDKKPIAYYSTIRDCDLLQETDITIGEAYEKQTYFIQAEHIKNKNEDNSYRDTFNRSNLLDDGNNDKNPFLKTKITEDDIEIITSNIDLNKCDDYYENNFYDCHYKNNNQECYYQKYGYCPYRFSTEKHPRRIRTLQQSKSNRFNLIQELSKVFEVYPRFTINHDDFGRVLLEEKSPQEYIPQKYVYFMTEKGQERFGGFRYEKNLSNMTRTNTSDTITTKMFVDPIDSEYYDTGYCTIQTARDNIGKNSYILDFSYYVKKGKLDNIQTERDLYGLNGNEDMAFLVKMDKLNSEYDKNQRTISNLTDKNYNDLIAKNETLLTGVGAALEQRQKLAQKMYQYKMTTKTKKDNIITEHVEQISDTYKNLLEQYKEQGNILYSNIETLFFTDNYYYDEKIKEYTEDEKAENKNCRGEYFWKNIICDNTKQWNGNWEEYKKQIIDENIYTGAGTIGQQTAFYKQIRQLKLKNESLLQKIRTLHINFHKKYELYIKEGTWSDQNYLSDNEYYWGGVSVLDDSSKPKVTYNFQVINLETLSDEYKEDYEVDLGDITYIEDIDFFGINSITGLPNKEKVLVSEIDFSLDLSQEDNIQVQNYTTQFEDLFHQITASVQSLTYNENIYRRASSFTAKHYVEQDSLQGTLDQGDLTLLNANDSIKIDDDGTAGNSINNSSSRYLLNGDGLFFSNNGGQTWNKAIGPKGINMDYAKFGSIDASKVQIVDGNYIYFLWDKNGINAYRNPSATTNGLKDFARFNKYGLSLIEKGKIRLRAGYEFQGSSDDGDYSFEKELSNQNVGFYLYNDTGKPIFKTETASMYNDNTTDYSARLSLRGEMYVTSGNLSNNDNTITTLNTYILSHGYNFDRLSDCYKKIDEIGLNNVDYYILDLQDNEKYKTSITMNNGESKIVAFYKKINIQDTFNGRYVENNTLKTKQFKTFIFEFKQATLTCNQDNSTFTLNSTNYDLIQNNAEINHITFTYMTINSATSILDSNFNEYQINGDILIKRNDDSTKSLKIYQDLESSSIHYFPNLNDNATMITKTLYCQPNGEFDYWENKKQDSQEEQTTDRTTNEIGIYINNKISLDGNGNMTYINSDDENSNLGAASERIFSILQKTENKQGGQSYQNLFTVLKNGFVYIGGYVKDQNYNDFAIPDLSYMPDVISIVKPTMIVSNNNNVWMNWNHLFQINEEGVPLITNDSEHNGSLQDYLLTLKTNIEGIASSGGGGGNGGGNPTPRPYITDPEIQYGSYYLTEPIGD